MAVFVDREGIESCISKINEAIKSLTEAAGSIDTTMGDITQYWKGAAADKAQGRYADEYKTLLTKTVPENVEEFKKFIDGCKNTIIDIDNQLSGQ